MTTTHPRRRSRTRAITLSLTAAVALVLTLAAPAGAVGTASVSAPTGTVYVDSDLVTVSGSVPTGTTSLAVALCDVTSTTTPGSRCDINTALAPDSQWLTGTGTYVVTDFHLVDSWAPDWNLITGSPFPVTGTSTTCASIGTDSCAVVVSFYGSTGFLGFAVSSTLGF